MGDENNKPDPKPDAATPASSEAPVAKKRKPLSLDIKDLSDVVERKISPAA